VIGITRAAGNFNKALLILILLLMFKAFSVPLFRHADRRFQYQLFILDVSPTPAGLGFVVSLDLALSLMYIPGAAAVVAWHTGNHFWVPGNWRAIPALLESQ
jgi:hypothetical protein